jgi:hypothetical protein
MDTRDWGVATLAELFGADVLLPEQFFRQGAASQRSGERALMWAVFADGIECYRRNINAKSAPDRVAFLEAESWIFRNDYDWPFSFVNLCEVFGFDPRGVRHALLRWAKARRKRPLRRQRFRPAALRAA